LRLAIVVSCVLAVVLSGCSTYSRVSAKVGSEDLSGAYRFEGFPRGVRPDQYPNPLINWAEVALDSDVTLQQRGERLIAHYTNSVGRVVQREIRLDDEGISFKKGVLTFRERVPLQDAAIFPGNVKQYAGVRYLQDADGNLRVIGFFRETGWMLYVFPFTDHHEYDLVLKPVEAR
jgi:hypothetical protein